MFLFISETRYQCPESEIRANSEMDGLDQSGNISKILELRVFAKMVWQRQDFLDLYTISPVGGHIMKGSALRFFRYPLTGLSSILPRKFVNDFLTQDTSIYLYK